MLIGSLKSENAAAKEKENESLKEFATLTVNLHKANAELNLKSEELEKTNIRLEHINTEVYGARCQLTEMGSIKNENLNLKKSLMSLENEKQVKLKENCLMSK